MRAAVSALAWLVASLLAWHPAFRGLKDGAVPPLPSCGTCQATWQAIKDDWRRLEPDVVADVPAAVCSRSSLPALCDSVVAAALETLNATVEGLNVTEACEVMHLCPDAAETATVLV